jgi:F-type H+-transporting ATPase subunit b
VLAALVLAVEEISVKAKNPILPEGKEIVWAVISFAIVFALLAWKAWPAIKKALKDREDRIRGDLERAEQARIEGESSLEEYRKQLAEARSEAAKIIEEARLAAEQVRQERIAAIDGEIAEHRARAQEDIRLATERAMAELQGRVSELSIELAEKVVERNLDHDTQIRLIENYINQVGSN